MKRNVLTRFVLIAVATLVVSMVPTVQARTCSNATAAGTWGFTTTGTFLFPSPSGPVLVPIVNVGIFTADEAGNFVGSQTRNVAGGVADETIKGTLSLDPDCTGTFIAQAFDPSSGALIGTSTIKIALDDNARQLQVIFTKSVDPNGKPLLGVLSGAGERVFAKDEEDGCRLATLKGSWVSAINGAIVGVGPIAVLGVTKFDGEGHFSMDATAVIDGNVFPDHTTGTYTVNDNCTGRTLDSIGDSSTFVIVGNRSQVIAIGTKPGVVATLKFTKQAELPASGAPIP